MATMQPMTKESELRIKRVLEGAVPDIVSGMSPNDALCKSAIAQALPKGHIDAVARAYNAGRTEAQRKTAADALSRSEPFELADAAKISATMFPEKTNSLGVLKQAFVVSDEYKRPPSFLRQREDWAAAERFTSHMTKVAEAAPKTQPTPAPKTAHEALEEVKENRRQIEKAAVDLHSLQLSLKTALKKLASEITQEGNYPQFRENAVILFGPRADKILGYIDRRESLAKFAWTKKAGPIDPEHGPYATLKTVIELTDGVISGEKLAKTVQDLAARREVELLAPFVDRALPSVLGPYLVKRSFLGGFLGTAIGTTAGREFANQLNPSTESLRNKVQDKVTDPQHEIGMRNLQTEAMLNDLLANDDVISTHKPEEVIGHFNEISQLAPRAANQSGLMRSVLRKRLQQGALDPYEIDMLLKIENGLRMRDNASQGVLGDGPSVLS